MGNPTQHIFRSIDPPLQESLDAQVSTIIENKKNDIKFPLYNTNSN